MTLEGVVGELRRVSGRLDFWVAEECLGALTENVDMVSRMCFHYCTPWPFYVQLEQQQDKYSYCIFSLGLIRSNHSSLEILHFCPSMNLSGRLGFVRCQLPFSFMTLSGPLSTR